MRKPRRNKAGTDKADEIPQGQHQEQGTGFAMGEMEFLLDCRHQRRYDDSGNKVKIKDCRKKKKRSQLGTKRRHPVLAGFNGMGGDHGHTSFLIMPPVAA